MNKENNQLSKSHHPRLNNPILYASLCFVLTIVLVLGLLPTPAFSFLGQNYVQPAFAQLGDDISNNIQEATEPWNIIGGKEEFIHIPNEYDSEILSEDYLFTDNSEDEEGVEKHSKYSHEEIKAEIDRLNTKAANNGPIAKYRTVDHTDWIYLDTEDQLRAAFDDSKNWNGLECDLLIKDTLLLDESLWVHSNSKIVINMHGCHIRRHHSKAQTDGEVITIKAKANLTINGVSSEEEKEYEHTGVRGYTDHQGHYKDFIVYGAVLGGGYSENGGGGIEIYDDGGCEITLNDCKVFGNRSDGTPYREHGVGGNIRIQSDNNNLYLNNCEISRGYSENPGGGIGLTEDALHNNIYLKNTVIDSNFTSDEGGGIADKGIWNNIYGDAVMGDFEHGSRVSNNVCDEDGGGYVCLLDNEDEYSSISGINFIDNKANEHGGGVSAISGKCSVTNCNFSGNRAEEGGGLYAGYANDMLEYYQSSLSVANCEIVNNRVFEGGIGAGILSCRDSISLSGKVICNNNFLDNGQGAEQDLNIYSHSCYVAPSLSKDSFVGIYRREIDVRDREEITNKTGIYNPRCFFSNLYNYHIEYNENSRHLKFTKGHEEKPDGPYDFDIKEIAHQVAIDNPVAGLNYQSGGHDYEVYRGTASYGIMTNSDDYLSTYYYYSDGYFADDPQVYNDHLSSLSMTAEIACSRENQYLPGGNMPDINYSTKCTNIAQFFADIGCNQQDIFMNEHYLVKPDTNSIGCAIASKQLTLYNEEGEPDDSYILMPIVVRGLGYEAEWTSNFLLGETGPHQGFSNAANKVLNNIDQYIWEHDLNAKAKEGKIKFWIMGHSRAGATSNLAGKRLTDKYGADGNNVFCYAFEPPMCADSNNMDLVIAPYTYNGEYKNIHNVINYADIVIHIPYVGMGFTRYGVTHYLPGSDTKEDPSRWPVVYDLVDVADNYPAWPNYWDNNSKYVEARDRMIEQYTATNPYEWYVDAIRSAVVYVPDRGIKEDGHMRQAEVAITQGIYDLFVHSFHERSELTLRQRYITKSSRCTNSFEYSVGDILRVFMSLNPQAQSAIFASFSSIMNHIDFIFDLLPIIIVKLPYYYDGSVELKWNLINQLNGIIKETLYNSREFKEYISSEDRNRLFDDLKNVLYYVLNFASKDWHRDSFWDIESEGDLKGAPVISTLVQSVGYILMNHYPECSLAWARAYDDYYQSEDRDDTSPVKVIWNKCPSPTDPKILYNEKEYEGKVSNWNDDIEPIDFDKSNVFQLFTDGNNGDVIYYNMEKTDNPDEVKDPTVTYEANHYQTNITVNTDPASKPPVDLANIGEEDYDIYTVKAVSLRFNKFSNVRTFKLKIHNGYNVIIESPAYEKRINKRVQFGDNLLLSTDPIWKGEKFSSWKVLNAEKEDVTEDIFIAEDEVATNDPSNHDPVKTCNKNINTTWVKMRNYSLHFIAQYENPESELRIDIDGPRFNETLPDKMQPSFVIGSQKISTFVDVDIKWHKDTKDGEDVTGQIMEPNQTYVWEAKIQLDFDKGITLPAKEKLHLFENDTEVASDHFVIEQHYDSDTPYVTLYRTIKNDDVVALGFIDSVSNIQTDDLRLIGLGYVVEYLEGILPYEVHLTTNYGPLSVELEGDRWNIWDRRIRDNLQNLLINQEYSLTSISCKAYIPKWIDCSNIGTITLKAHLYMANSHKANVPLTDLEPGTYYPSAGDIYKVKLTNGMGISIKYTLDGTDPTESPTAIECNDGDTVTLDWAKDSSITIKTFTPAYVDPEQPESRWYDASEVKDYTYTFATKPVPEVHKITIDYIDSLSYIISDSTEVPFTELDDFSFHITNFDGYEFKEWANDPHEPGEPEIINNENKNNHIIKVSKRNTDAHVRAIYKPVISSVEISLLQPVALNELSTNVVSAKIIGKGIEESIKPEDIDKYITFHWIYDKGETWSDTPKMAKYSEDYLASIDINNEYFKNKQWFLPAFVNVKVVNNDTGEKICSGYYSTTKSDLDEHISHFYVNAKPPATLKAKLLSIDSLPEIRNVQHGISIEELKSALPTTVGIDAEGGIRDKAEIEWNIGGCVPAYDPVSVEPQFLTIPGKAIIPEYIDNGGATPTIPTDLEIHVNVDGAQRSEEPTIYPDPTTTYYHNIKASLNCKTDNSEIYYKVKLETIEPNGITKVTENEEYSLYTEPFDITCDDGKKLFATVSCYSKAEGYRQSTEIDYSLIIDRTYKKCLEVVMPEPFEMPIYEQSNIVPTLVPEDTEDNRLNFESSDENVVSVNKHTGQISANGLGTCTITATTTRGFVSGSTIITVIPATFEVFGPQEDYVWHSGLNQEYIIDGEYDTFQGVYVDDSTTPLDPSNYTVESKPVTYSLFGDRPEIENQTVVKFMASYLDTLERKEHKFKFAFPDGYGIGKQTVRFVDCEKISIWPPLMYLPLNGQGTMKVASYVPENTDDKTVTYESSAPQIASVDPNTGLITAHGIIGQCTITTTTKWGHISCNTSVLVVDNVYQVDGPQDDYVWYSGIDQEFIVHHSIDTFNAIKLDGGQTLTKDEHYMIEADGENTKITLKSSYLDTVERGDHYIEFIYGDGIGLSTNKVRFVDCEQVSFYPAQLDIEVYSDAQLNLVLTPENTDDNIITYTSSNPDVASVDETGKVTANAMGDCSITATTKWGKVSGSANVHVHGLTYEFAETPDLTYILTSNESRTFKVAVDVAKFTSVTCDENTVDEVNYEVNKEETALDLLQLGEGYTVVTIMPSLFETLSADTHEIAINFDDGSATATMTILEPEPEYINGGAQTGDNMFVWIYPLIALLAVGACTSGVVIRRRKKK